LKILAECKEYAKDTVSPSYKLTRKGVKCQEGKRKSIEGCKGTENLGSFQAEKSRRRVCTELYKECKISSRTT
jgi:hypothetical protein